MAERLGNVLYWAACILVWLIIAAAAAMFLLAPNMQQPDKWFFLAVAASLALPVWLVGRAARYVLAGK